MKNPPTGLLKNPKLKVSQSARRKGRGFCLFRHWDVFKFYKGDSLNGGLISATRFKKRSLKIDLPRDKVCVA